MPNKSAFQLDHEMTPDGDDKVKTVIQSSFKEERDFKAENFFRGCID